ncbi:hypothetical protein LT330_007244 [Penicillium expansum]|nr:hypothetical protein LT330_007244 [Penicillium expansum]
MDMERLTSRLGRRNTRSLFNSLDRSHSSDDFSLVAPKQNSEVQRAQNPTIQEVIELGPDRPGSPISSETSSEGINLHELPDNAQILKFASKTKTDTTLHFVLNIVDDIEGQLEELGRLKRWGHFKEALEYFESNLEQHIDLPMVKIEYADLLLEQGAYRKLIQLGLEAPSQPKYIPVRGVYRPELYSTHFNAIHKSARFASESFAADDLGGDQMDKFTFYLHKRVNDQRNSHRKFDVGIPFDFSEIQIIRNQLKLLVQIRDKDPDDNVSPDFGIGFWKDIYDDLLMGGRIWEFCDLFNAMLPYLGQFDTWKALYDAESPEAELNLSLERLQQDWSVDQYDESTELAMLSILVHIAHELGPRSRYGIPNNDKAANIKLCLRKAEFYAAEIQTHSPQLTRSRPYLQWVIAKECFDRRLNCSSSYRKLRESHFNNCSGEVIGDGQIPIYVPVGPTDIGWPAPDPDFPPNNTLKWALLTSRELGDYETESMCLRELICREKDPRSLFAQLSKLLRDTQGNNLAHYDTCLSQYLLTDNDVSRRKLIQELEQVANKFKPASHADICIKIRRSGLLVLCGLMLLFSECRSEMYVIQRTILALDREISLRPKKPYTFSVPRVHSEGYLRREPSQFEYQELLKTRKEAMQMKLHQKAAESRENESETETVKQNKNQDPEPKLINRQPTVSDFDDTATPSSETHQPNHSVEWPEAEEDSDGEAQTLVRAHHSQGS